MATTTTITWMLTKAAELEQQAAALRTAAAILDGMVGAQKRATVAHTVGQAVALRKAQRNGAVAHPATNGATHRAGETGVPLTAHQRSLLLAPQRAEKRDQIVAIIRDYGKPMPLAALKAAAAEQGITSLTGIVSYVRAGYIHRTGKKGRTRYSFVALPTDAAAEA